MSKETAVIGLGVWIILATQLGIAYHPWLVLLFALSGIAVTILGLLLRGESIARGAHRSQHDAYVEHIPQLPLEHEHAEKIQ